MGLAICCIINYPNSKRLESTTKDIFGHSGIGGAVAFGDVEKEIGFGFICNKQHKLNELYKTSNELSKALISII